MSASMMVYYTLHVLRIFLLVWWMFFDQNIKFLVGAMVASILVLEMDNFFFHGMFKGFLNHMFGNAQMGNLTDMKDIQNRNIAGKEPVGFKSEK